MTVTGSSSFLGVEHRTAPSPVLTAAGPWTAAGLVLSLDPGVWKFWGPCQGEGSLNAPQRAGLQVCGCHR